MQTIPIVCPEKLFATQHATESAQVLLSQALNELNFDAVVAAVDSLNIASERVLQKIGMQYWKDIDWETTPSGFARCYKSFRH